MEFIYNIIKNIVACYLVLRILLEVIPGTKYRKYVKLFGSFLILLSLLQQVSIGLHNDIGLNLEHQILEYEKKLNQDTFDLESSQNIMHSTVLSTYEEEIKTQLNKELFGEEMMVNTVKLGVCEDVNDNEYGKISYLEVYISKNVDKTANISVNKIIIRQLTKDEGNLQAEEYRTEIAQLLNLSEEKITIYLS
ncbi:MAG: stage III sporulation protein AF [Lachnospiraceae bacterium]|nr:stage III sporulation protein AF [Lachnospiraceae bacterium]